MGQDNSSMNESKSDLKSRGRLVVAFVILVFTVVSIWGINPYRYGLHDQSITTSYLKTYVDDKLYPNDYLVAGRTYYTSYLWPALGWLIKFLGVNTPALFFAGYCIALYMTFLGVYLIAMTLWGKAEIAFLALFFLLFSKDVPGGVFTVESLFLTRTAALPILLFSINFFLKRKFLLSFALQGIAFLVHPLTAIFVIAMTSVASAIHLKDIGIKKFVHSFFAMLALASPILFWKVRSSPDSHTLFYADPRWVEVLRLRMFWVIFPLSWTKKVFVQAGLHLLTFLIAWKHKPQSWHHCVVLAFAGTVIALCAIGTIFSEFIPLPIVMSLQIMRNFRFLMYFSMIYFANYFLTEISLRESIFDKLLVALASIGILLGAAYWEYALAAFLFLAILLILGQLVRWQALTQNYFILALVAIVLVLGCGAYLRNDNFSIENAQEENWLDVQKWARKSTDLEDVFIVPPNLDGFRIESERTIYGDWKDGSEMGLNPSFGYEWFERMKALGYQKGISLEDGFKNLDETDFINIANTIRVNGHRAFLVMFKERDTLDFPVIYTNERFTVYEILQ